MTREAGIIMQAHSVRCSLDGTKTQTRRLVTERNLRVRLHRVVKSEWYNTPIGRSGAIPMYAASQGVYHAGMNQHGAVYIDLPNKEEFGVKPGEFEWVSPYGEVGDRMWVREAWAHFDLKHPRARICYRASMVSYGLAHDAMTGEPLRLFPEPVYESQNTKWKSPIHMPRWASRLSLVITSVRVERLQAISPGDILAEGGPALAESGAVGTMEAPRSVLLGDQRFAWSQAWDSINKKRASWASNPWVWVIGYQRAQARAEAA